MAFSAYAFFLCISAIVFVLIDICFFYMSWTTGSGTLVAVLIVKAPGRRNFSPERGKSSSSEPTKVVLKTEMRTGDLKCWDGGTSLLCLVSVMCESDAHLWLEIFHTLFFKKKVAPQPLLSKGNLENIKWYYMMMLNDACRGWGQKLSLSGAGYTTFCWVDCQKKHCSKLISHTTVMWRELPCPFPVPGLLLTDDAAALSSWDLFSTTGPWGLLFCQAAQCFLLNLLFPQS